MPPSLPPEARARLDHHLDAVEAALISAGHSRDQRRAVLDDLESQITDMLAAHSASPTAADVKAVLAKVDPPAAYATPAALAPPQHAAPSANPRYSITAVWAFGCVLGSIVSIAMLNYVIFGALNSHDVGSSSGPARVPIFLTISQGFVFLLYVGGLVGTILGWAAFIQIRTAKGALRGTVLALFAGLFYPTILAFALLIALLSKQK